MKTKDYVYLDNELLNSHLAQFEKGLLTKETTEHGTESSDTINGWSNTASGLNGILGIGVKFQYDVHEGDSTVESEFTKNIVENVLNDYAVDLLIEDCDKNNLLHNLCQSNEGDFTLFSSEFKIYDFEYLKSITNPQLLAPILSKATPPVAPGPQASKQARIEYQKQLKHYNDSKKVPDVYELLNDFSIFADALFGDSVLVKQNGCLAICKRKNLRLSKAQASFENESNRKIKVFGVVSATKGKTHPDGDVPIFELNDLDKISSLLFDITLSNFNMLHDNDKIIKPIAIYFEAE